MVTQTQFTCKIRRARDFGCAPLQTDSAFGPALQCIFLIMAGIGGKLLVFQSAPPSVGVGRVAKNRDEARGF